MADLAPTPTAVAAKKPLTPEQLLNDPKYDLHPFKEPTKRYVVFSSQRTGSTYLCRRLCNVKGQFGVPSEYLNPVNVNLLVPRLLPGAGQDGKTVGAGRYLKMLQRARTTDDGYFGIKVQPQQLLGLTNRKKNGALEFLSSFDRVVLLTRRDKLGQAISGAVAATTGKWFNDQKEAELTDAQIDTLFPLIARNLSRYFEEEQLILSLAKTIQKPVFSMQFEDIAADGEKSFRALVNFLSDGEDVAIEEDESFAAVPEKPEGLLKKRIRERFIQFLKNE